MYKKLTNVFVLFLSFLLLGYSNGSLNPTFYPFVKSLSTAQKIEREAENTAKLKRISKITKQDLLATLEKLFCDNEEIQESENSNSNSTVFLANNNSEKGITLLLLDKKNSTLSATFDLENLQHNRLFILFHSWKFHLI